MKNDSLQSRRLAARIFCAALLASASLTMTAQAQTRFNSQPGKSTVTVDGASTTHDWEMVGHVIGGYFELGAGVELDPAKGAITGLKDGKLPATGRANIAVTTIHSKAEHMADVMDHLMQEALKAETEPSIRYVVSELTPTNLMAGKPMEFMAKGDLSIAGVTNTMSFPVTIELVDAAHLHVNGIAKFKMTDFKITPPAPTITLGTLKCADDVTIIFDWFLQKRAQ